MAHWRLDTTTGKASDYYDDGLLFYPGDDGFTRSLAETYFNTTAFSYMGTPDWEAPVDTTEE